MKPRYMDYLVNDDIIVTSESKNIRLLELKIGDDDGIIEEWSSNFRNNYCTDIEMDVLRKGYGYSRAEFLEKIKFPDRKESLGCSTRSGDFCEILVADYAQFVLNYYIPRTRYDRKINPNSSSMGSDLLGFKVGPKISQNDEMIIFEVKAQASETSPTNKLQQAVNDSQKDVKRIAVSLNAANQRLIDKGLFEEAEIIQRFQNATDRPYKRKFAAAAVHSNKSFSKEIIEEVSTIEHIDPDIFMMVIRGEELMNFIHELYKRACVC